jgi:predicted transcriptional regulator
MLPATRLVTARTRYALQALAEEDDRDLAYVMRAAIKFYLKAKHRVERKVAV